MQSAMMRPLAAAETSQTQHTAQSPQEKKPRTTTTLACTACRKRKTKCNGLQPCTQCETKSTDCVYEHRPRPHEMQTALRDKDSELKHYQRFVAALKSVALPDAQAMLKQLREGDEPGGIVEAFEGSESASPADSQDYLPLGWSQISHEYSIPSNASGSTDMERLRRASWHPALQFLAFSKPFSPYLSNPCAPLYEPITAPNGLHWQPPCPSTFPSGQQLWSAAGTTLAFHDDFSGTWEHPLDPQASTPKADPALPTFKENFLSSKLISTHMFLNSNASNVPASSARAFPLDGRLQVFGNLPMSSSILAAHYPGEIRNLQLKNFQVPEYLVMPLAEYENTAVGGRWMDFRNEARTCIMNRVYTPEQILGPDEVCVDLFFRERQPNDAYTVAMFVCELVHIYQCQDRMVALASIALMTRLMRWMIHPTPETYARVPDIMKPTLAQRLIPHPAVVDTIAFCEVRDRMIINLEDYMTNLIWQCSMEWPHDISAAVDVDQVLGTHTLSTDFEAHIVELSNWKHTSECLAQFPFLKDQVHLKQPFETLPSSNNVLLSEPVHA